MGKLSQEAIKKVVLELKGRWHENQEEDPLLDTFLDTENISFLVSDYEHKEYSVREFINGHYGELNTYEMAYIVSIIGTFDSLWDNLCGSLNVVSGYKNPIMYHSWRAVVSSPCKTITDIKNEIRELANNYAAMTFMEMVHE